MSFYVYFKKLDVGTHVVDLVNEEEIKQTMKEHAEEDILIIEENGDVFYGNQ